MEIRRAEPQELPQLLEIYERARTFMADHGNYRQWGPNRWPPQSVIEADIACGTCYVCVADGRIAGTFHFSQGDDPEPTYDAITDGQWSREGPYGVVHRLASAGIVPGVGRACLDWAYARCGYVRIDTHPDNAVMRSLLERCGFRPCGTVHVLQDAMPRIAFDKS